MLKARLRVERMRDAERTISDLQAALLSSSYIVFHYLGTKAKKAPEWGKIFPAKAIEAMAVEIRKAAGDEEPERKPTPRKQIDAPKPKSGNIHALKVLLRKP